MDSILDSVQAARYLGIKRGTLYAYVSRGLVAPIRPLGGGKSYFRLEDLERLLGRSERQRVDSSRFPTITTSITTLTEKDHLYRGMPVNDLLRVSHFEGVAELLWQVKAGSWRPIELQFDHSVPPEASISLTLARLTIDDPSATDRDPATVANFARRLIATVALGQRQLAVSGPSTDGDSVSANLAAAFAGKCTPLSELQRVIDGLLIICADHELTPATLAVRIAANEQAGLATALLAGVSVFSGYLQNSIADAVELLKVASVFGADEALDRQLGKAGDPLTFGHQQRKQEYEDQRYSQVMAYFDDVATKEQRETFAEVIQALRQREIPLPNIRFAIAAVIWAFDARAPLGTVVYLISRMAGWTAHYLEEMNSVPRRFRVDPTYATSDADVDSC